MTGVAVCLNPNAGTNPETAQSNSFQLVGDTEDAQIAWQEQQEFARLLRAEGIRVVALGAPPGTPDAAFPNNWFSTHADGTVVIYPMESELRRREREVDHLLSRLDEGGWAVNQVLNLAYLEDSGVYLEGTGSLVIDRPNRVAYASISSRTHPEAVSIACAALKLEPLVFETSFLGQPIYHTNVVLSVGSDFAVVCREVIPNPNELVCNLMLTGKHIVTISVDQLAAFCGNIFQVDDKILMSKTARYAFRPDQLEVIAQGRKLIVADVSTLEKLGGGSVRCMVAEIRLPLKPVTAL
ncbi:MAG: arginine deiminase-related protein [Fimbriimonadaceae bacterium]